VQFAPTATGTVTATLTAAGKNRAAAASDTLTGTGKGLGGTQGHIYWSNQSTGTISAAPLTGGIPTTLASGQINPAGVAVDASNIYWADTGKTGFPGTIWKAPLAGGSRPSWPAGRTTRSGWRSIAATSTGPTRETARSGMSR
jgi:hypothetical protein